MARIFICPTKINMPNVIESPWAALKPKAKNLISRRLLSPEQVLQRYYFIKPGCGNLKLCTLHNMVG